MAFRRAAELGIGRRPRRRFIARAASLVGQCRAWGGLRRRHHRRDRNVHPDGHVCLGRVGATHRYGDSPADADRQPYPATYQHLDAHLGADRHAHGDADAYAAPGADFHS